MSIIKKGALALLLLGVLGAGAWWGMPQKVAPENRYVTAALERGPITQLVSANGTLNPVKLVSVGSQVSGIVKKIYADFNDQVQAGQVLLELDPALTQAQLQQSTANVSNAKASLELALANELRMNTLYAQEYVSRQELDQAIQALKSAQAQLAVAEAQAERDRTNLAYTVIRSPVSGVVVSREVDIGQTVAASFQTPTLFKIAQDLRKMQIDSNYAEADVGSIRVGQPTTFRVDAFPDRTFSGEVRQVRLNPTTQQNVVTYNVVIAVDNADQVLMPGMTAYVSIIVAQRKEALLVPNAALRFRPSEVKPGTGKPRADGRAPGGGKERGGADPGRTGSVYVIENGALKPVRIGIGITDNRFTEVLGGELKEGAKVVVEDTQPAARNSGGAPGMRLF
ncbi:MAG: efflux RND transporter periplasmic adaptor subunit [Nitrosomonadales bacterium]|nr:efflux RND transporter periplasmic adaptor subunit [Nitrosomonadales bacterium]